VVAARRSASRGRWAVARHRDQSRQGSDRAARRQSSGLDPPGRGRLEGGSRRSVRGRPVGLMWLSPDCKHFSKAKGGKPVSKKIRGLAWVAIRWAAAVRPRVIVLENVEEFQTWGPVLRDSGMPCQGAPRPDLPRVRQSAAKARLRRRVARAPRLRLRRADDSEAVLPVARCDGQPIVWPTPTHGKGSGASVADSSRVHRLGDPGATRSSSRRKRARCSV
jgi:hypothetical protein